MRERRTPTATTTPPTTGGPHRAPTGPSTGPSTHDDQDSAETPGDARAPSNRASDLPALKRVLTLGEIPLPPTGQLDVGGDPPRIAFVANDQVNVRTLEGELLWQRALETDGERGARAIQALRFSPDASTLAVGWQTADGGGVTVYEAASGDVLRELDCGQRGAASISFAADGESFVTADGRRWRIDDDDDDDERLPGIDDAEHVVASPDGRWLATVEREPVSHTTAPDGRRRYQRPRVRVALTHIPSGEQRTASTGFSTMRLAFTPDSGHLVIAGGGRRLQAIPLEAQSGSVGDATRTSFSGSIALATSSGGHVAVADTKHRVSLFELPELKPIGDVSGFASPPGVLAFTDDAAALVVASHRDAVRVFDVPSLDERTPGHGHRAAVRALSFVATERRLVTAADDHTVRLWNTGDGELLDTRPIDAPVRGLAAVQALGDGGSDDTAANSATHVTAFAPSVGTEPALRLRWPLAGDAIRGFGDVDRMPLVFLLHGDVSPTDGRIVASSSADSLVVYAPGDSPDRHTVTLSDTDAAATTSGVHVCAPDGDGHVAWMAHTTNDTLVVRSIEDGTPRLRCPSESGFASGAACSSDGRTAAWYRSGELHWCRGAEDDVDGAVSSVAHESLVHALRVDRSGTLLYAGVAGGVERWDIATGERLDRVESGSPWPVTSLAVSDDEQHLAGGMGDGHIVLWTLSAP